MPKAWWSLEKRKLINTMLVTENWGCPPQQKASGAFFVLVHFRVPWFAGASGDILRRSQLEGFLKNWALRFHFFRQMVYPSFQKKELLKLHQELWGHIFVGAYWDPNYMLDMSTKTSHKMTVMIKAPRKQTTLHGTASGSCIILWLTRYQASWTGGSQVLSIQKQPAWETGNLVPCWPCLKKATFHRRKAAKRSLKTQLHFLARVVPLRVCCWLWFLRGRFMNVGISKIFKENREYGANRDQIARSNNHCLMEND